MAKAASDTSSASAEEALKRRKKQARREAKLMLAMEEAHKDLKKAQKKQSKAQARLEERSTVLNTLEAKMEELSTPTPEPAIEATPHSAELESQQVPSELESSMLRSDGQQVTSPDQQYQGEMTSLTDQILASPHVEGEEATPQEGTAVIKDTTGGEAMQEHETAVERAPAPTTQKKTSAQKPAATRTAAATNRPASRSQRTSKPSSDGGHVG